MSLNSDRQVFVYERNGIPVGYGYLGHGTGPIALLDPGDFPAILAHAERSAAERGDTHIGFNVPMISRSAVAYLLDRGYRIDDYMILLMSDTAFGRFENYIITDPPLFL